MAVIVGTVAALGEAVSYSLSTNTQTVVVQVTGTWVGTLNFEASIDGGASWFAIQVGSFPDLTQIGTTVINGVFTLLTAAFDAIRVRASLWTSGTATVAISASAGLKLRPSAGAGAQGPQGDPGPAGQTGPVGPVGFPGDDGEPGEMGFPGSQGLQGSAGAPGAQGAAGVDGPPGPPGLDGEDGEIGPPGPPGTPGNAGAQGMQGVAGSAGSDGPPGVDGFDGDQGEMGPPGPQGQAGVAGAPGSQGAAGLPGPQGPPGIDADEPEYPYVIPGERGPQGLAGGGGGSATTVEVDLGTVPTWRGKFTITDAAIGPSSKVLAWQAPGPYTGKGTAAGSTDEGTMDPIHVATVIPASGSAVLHWETVLGASWQWNKMGGRGTAQTPGVPETRPAPQDDPQARAYMGRIGKVRGNVKFSYVVFA